MRAYFVFNALLLFACVLDFCTTRQALSDGYQEANPAAPSDVGAMALTTIAIFFVCSGLYYFARRVLRTLDAPKPGNRTLLRLLSKLDGSPLVGLAFGLAPLPFVALMLKFLAGADNLLLITHGGNFSSTVRASFPALSTGQFFVAELVVFGIIFYVLTYAWMLRRWARTGSLMGIAHRQ